jgi:hypothetical protein
MTTDPLAPTTSRDKAIDVFTDVTGYDYLDSIGDGLDAAHAAGHFVWADENREAEHWLERFREADNERAMLRSILREYGVVVPDNQVSTPSSLGEEVAERYGVTRTARVRAAVRSGMPELAAQQLADQLEHRDDFDTALDVLGDLTDWFGVPEWSGPPLPRYLGGRIATLMERHRPVTAWVLSDDTEAESDER